MGYILSKFFACLFCFCPDRNCYDKQERQIRIIYDKIKPHEDYVGTDNPEEMV